MSVIVIDILLGLLALIGIILLLTVLLLLIPVTIKIIHQNDDTFIEAKWLFIKKILLPAPEKAPKEKKTKKPKEKKPATKEGTPSPKKDKIAAIMEYMSLVSPILKAIKKPMKSLLKTIKIKINHLTLTINSEDSAQTAILYGKISGVFYSFYSLVARTFSLKAKDITLAPDFLGEKSKFSCNMEIVIIPIVTLVPSVAMIINISKEVLKHKGDKEDERQNQPE